MLIVMNHSKQNVKCEKNNHLSNTSFNATHNFIVSSHKLPLTSVKSCSAFFHRERNGMIILKVKLKFLMADSTSTSSK